MNSENVIKGADGLARVAKLAGNEKGGEKGDVATM